MSENKYLNEAIIGNKNMIATYTGKGELRKSIRLNLFTR